MTGNRLLQRVLHVVTLLPILLAATAAWSQAPSYPSKPIHIVVPFGPGSVTDILARIIGAGLSASLGQAVIIDNKAGAGGNIGAAAVAAAPPDGYTLLMGPVSTNAINPSLYENLSFEPIRDFAPITNAATVANVLVVHPSVPARSVPELVSKMRSGDLTYASGGAGGAQHLSAELLKSMTGTEATHVPYKGGSAAMSDLLSGRVQFMFCNLPICLAHIRAGKLIALGVTSSQRSSLLPEVPTMAEAGLPGCGVDGWFGLFAPSSVPGDILDRLNAESVKILRSDSTRKLLLAQGAEPVANTRAAFDAFVRAEHDKWAEVIKKLNIRLD